MGNILKKYGYIPFFEPHIREEEREAVNRVLERNWLTTGPEVREFEKEFKEFVNSKVAVALSSATAGLHIALLSKGAGFSCDVFLPPLTFVSTAHVVLKTGANLVFIDVRDDTFNIDENRIEALIEEEYEFDGEKLLSKKTGNILCAVIPVHYGGVPSEMDKINHLSEKYNFNVIEDSAHAIGSEYKGKKIGDTKNLCVFSFYSNKNMTTAEGGMITTNEIGIERRLRILSLHGISKDAYKRLRGDGLPFYDVKELGYKYNLNDIQAAIGRAQLKKINYLNRERKRVYEIYREKLRNVEEVKFQKIPEYTKSSHHLFPIILSEKVDRDEFIKNLRDSGVQSSVHFIPVHTFSFYRKKFGYRCGMFPVSEKIFESEVSLPIYPQLDDDDLNFIIDKVKDAILKAKNE